MCNFPLFLSLLSLYKDTIRKGNVSYYIFFSLACKFSSQQTESGAEVDGQRAEIYTHFTIFSLSSYFDLSVARVSPTPRPRHRYWYSPSHIMLIKFRSSDGSHCRSPLASVQGCVFIILYWLINTRVRVLDGSGFKMARIPRHSKLHLWILSTAKEMNSRVIMAVPRP